MTSDIQVTLYFKKFSDTLPQFEKSLVLYTSKVKDFDYGCLSERLIGEHVIHDSEGPVELNNRFAPDYWAYLPEELPTA